MGSDTSSTSHLQGAFGMDLLVLGSNSDQPLSSFVFITRSFGTRFCAFFFGAELLISLIEFFLMRMTAVMERHFSTHGEHNKMDRASERVGCFGGASTL